MKKGSDGMGIIFRKAEAGDIDAVAKIYEAIHDEEAAGRLTTGWLRGIYPIRDTALAALDRGDLFVEEICGDGEESRIVGAAVINQVQVDVYEGAPWEYDVPDDKVMVIHCLVIDPAGYGKGYGSGFARFYEQYAAENGCEALRIDTNERNLRARAMYKSLGYKEIDIVPTEFNGIPGVMLVMLEKKVEA